MIEEKITLATLAIIALIALALIFQFVNPSFSEPFSELAILGPDMKLTGYPHEVSVGENFTLYLFVGNHEGHTMFYEVMVKLVNNQTTLSTSSPLNASVLATYYFVIMNNQNATKKIVLSIPYEGTNLRLVFELWAFSASSNSFYYKGISTYIWLNVTASKSV